MATTDGTLPETGLRKDTNWWGAFVIGLAGTILVTGIAPYVVQGTGALGVILIGVMALEVSSPASSTLPRCWISSSTRRSPRSSWSSGRTS